MNVNPGEETLTYKQQQWRPISDATDVAQWEEEEKPRLKQMQKQGLKRLPVFLHKGRRRLQYAWDGRRLRVVDEEIYSADKSRTILLHGWLENCLNTIGQTMRAIFVPENVRPNYMVYLRWKCAHRIFSSALQVQCTQAMLQAVGVGAKRALPSAAALNWVLKDGLGRLGRFAYTASLGRTFDSDLKRVRFSTSVIFSMSLGLELLTPKYPDKFLLLATIANVAKSISLAAYLATSSTIHRSFALADNLADLSAKSQAQTVVLDNLGLGLAVCINHICKHNSRLEKILPLATYPIFSAMDLFALYHGLQSVHFSTLNKARLEIVVERWLKHGKVPSVEEVNKAEGVQLFHSLGGRSLPLMIGAPKLRNQKPEDILTIIQTQPLEGQKYLLCMESYCNWPGKQWKGLLLWPHRTAGARDIVMGVLQASYLRVAAEGKQHTMGQNSVSDTCHFNQETEAGSCSRKSRELWVQQKNDGEFIKWQNALQGSRTFAQENIGPLLTEMEAAGWLVKHILLSSKESVSYSTT